MSRAAREGRRRWDPLRALRRLRAIGRRRRMAAAGAFSAPEGEPWVGLEPLEPRVLLSASAMAEVVSGSLTQSEDDGPSAIEQFMLELINRARSDPQAEADAFDIDLNDDLDPDTISDAPKQPLAFNPQLYEAARDHAQWMLDNDTLDTIGEGGSEPEDRMEAAGYVFEEGNSASAENVALVGVDRDIGDFSDRAFTIELYEDMFLGESEIGTGDAITREIMLLDFAREIGPAILQGEFTFEEEDFNTFITTLDIAFSGDQSFLTGVVFNDADDDEFYTPGEGLGGVTITADDGNGGVFTVDTFASGGYTLAVPDGTYTVTASGGDLDEPQTAENVGVGEENVRVAFMTAEEDGDPTNGEEPGDLLGEFSQGVIFQADDPDTGAPVTFRLTGPGEGRVLGENGRFDRIELSGTDNRSQLTILTGGRTETSVGDIVADGSLGGINGNTTNLRGDITINGELGRLFLQSVTGDQQNEILIGPADRPGAGTIMRLGSVEELSVNTQTPIRQLIATQWLDTDGTADLLVAPEIGVLNIQGSRPLDIDGDFQANVLLTDSGVPLTLRNMNVAGNVSGSTMRIGINPQDLNQAASGNAGNVTVRGNADNFNFEAGGLRVLNVVGGPNAQGTFNDSILLLTQTPERGFAVNNVTMGGANGSSILVNGPAGVVTVRGDADDLGINAHTLRTLNVMRNPRFDADGAFNNSTVTLTQAPQVGPSLNNAVIAGGTTGSTFNIAGEAGLVTIRGNAQDLDLEAATLRGLNVLRNPLIDADGELNDSSIVATQQPDRGFAINIVRVAGASTGTSILAVPVENGENGNNDAEPLLATGDVGTVFLTGPAQDLTLGAGSLRSLRLGDVGGESRVIVENDAGPVIAQRFQAGTTLQAGTMRTLNVTGDPRQDISGDFDGTLTLTDTPDRGFALNTANIRDRLGGTFSFSGAVGNIIAGGVAPIDPEDPGSGPSITAPTVRGIIVRGDLADAQINLTEPSADPRQLALTNMNVLGDIRDTDLRSAGNVGVVTAGGIENSQLLGGVSAETVGLPAATADFDNLDTELRALNLRPARAGDPAPFRGSNVAFGRLGNVNLQAVEPRQEDVPFGLAATEFNRTLFTDAQGERQVLRDADIDSFAADLDPEADDFTIQRVV